MYFIWGFMLLSVIVLYFANRPKADEKGRWSIGGKRGIVL
jgi:hypothetical protein